VQEDMFLSELKEDLKFIRNWSSSMERKIEPLFEDLYKMSNTLQTIQNHKDCTEEMFVLIEEMSDYT
jgi:hypothetical protein